MNGVLTILKKELRQIWRDPYTLGVAIFLPLVMLFLFGYALNLDVKDTPLAVVDLDNSPESRAYIDAFVNSDKFKIKHALTDPNAAAKLLDQGRTKLVMIIPHGFSRALLGGGAASVQTLVDGSFPTSALVIQKYVEATNAAFTARLIEEHFASLGLSNYGIMTPAVTANTRVRYNPSLKSDNFIIPGLISVLLMAFPPLLSALAIVREKESGSIQQIFISPIRPWAFILGKMVPYGVIAYIDLLLVVMGTRYWFGVPMAGSLVYFLLASVPYVISTVSIGLLVSTITRSQLVAMLMTIVLTIMPAFIFSGFMFPIYNMPEVFQAYSNIFPARFFMEITSHIFLRGVGPEVWGKQVAILILYAAGLIALSALRFRKKVI